MTTPNGTDDDSAAATRRKLVQERRAAALAVHKAEAERARAKKEQEHARNAAHCCAVINGCFDAAHFKLWIARCISDTKPTRFWFGAETDISRKRAPVRFEDLHIAAVLQDEWCQHGWKLTATPWNADTYFPRYARHNSYTIPLEYCTNYAYTTHLWHVTLAPPVDNAAAAAAAVRCCTLQ